jgi:DNA-binding NtrC family response regulator
MKTKFTLLVADRNPNVRALLQRELTAAGYQIRLAENAREVIKWAFQDAPLDLIILDPDLPDADETFMLEHLLDRIPMLPMVMHTYPSEYGTGFKDQKDVVFVEKGGRSVERLKRVVHETLVENPARRQ